MKKITILTLLLSIPFLFSGQIIVIDPGHGYDSGGGNPDGRSSIEIITALEVGLRLNTLITNGCSNWTSHMTRSTQNGWITLSQRSSMSNSWNADYFLSIHCNAGGGTGTETFWCTNNDPTPTPDINFATQIQADMVSYGQWANRRVVEDASYIFHLAVLGGSSAIGCLNEIGFVDHTGDAAKLNSSTWRDNFANAYFQAFNTILGNCSASACGTPSGLVASSITTSGAALSWNAVSGATSYNIQYKPTSGGTWTSTTSSTTSKSITGLTASTAYEFQVQAVCSTTGNYSSSATFTTSGLNNDCANAQTLTPNTTCVSTVGNIAGATAGALPKASCDGFGTPTLEDVWYKFTATATSHIITITPSASFDAVLSLYTSCSAGEIDCADNGGPGVVETITASGLSVGTTYYVRVYDYGSTVPTTTTFNICITTPAPPSCGTPSGLSANSVTASGATLNWAAVAGATSYNIQYKPTSGGTWTNTTSSTTSKSITGLTPSTSYEFQVQAVCSVTGTYSSSSTFTTAVSPGSNDNCANAQTLTPNTSCVSVSGDIAGATVSGLPKPSCDGFGTPALEDVWYKFTATATSHIITVTPSASFDAVLSLYTSCSGGEIGCADNGSEGVAETITAPGLSIGTTYYVRVYDYGSVGPTTTTFDICITAPTITTGDNEMQENIVSTFEVFPNPSDGSILHVKLANADTKKMDVTLYDMIGREVIAKEVSLEDGNFSLSFAKALTPGIYTLSGVTNKNRFTKRVVVK